MARFSENVIEHKLPVLISSTMFSETFLTFEEGLREIW